MRKFLAAGFLTMIATGAIAAGQTDILPPGPEVKAAAPKAEEPQRISPFSHTNFKECPSASLPAQARQDALTTQCL